MGHLTLDKSNHRAYKGGRILDLNPPEFDILWLLAEKPGKAFKESDLYEELKKVYPQLQENPFKKYFHQLRYKLNKKYIQVLGGDMYRLGY